MSEAVRARLLEAAAELGLPPDASFYVAPEELAARGQERSGPLPAQHAVAFLQYTSDSTAVPKGVIVTHDNPGDNSVRIREHQIPLGGLPRVHRARSRGGA